MSEIGKRRPRWNLLKKDVQFWGGVVMSLVGVAGIELGKPSFGFLMFFGGFSIGAAAVRSAYAVRSAADPKQD